MSAKELEKLIKIENGLFPFTGSLSEFFCSLVIAFEWEKFFEKEIKVCLDVVNMFFLAKFHLVELYVMVEMEKVEEYPGHQLINKPTQGLANRMLKVITWPSAE